MKRLGVNIDHVATLRNARGGFHPDPFLAAKQAMANGADSITIHLREDRRHIHDNDAKNIINISALPVNLECSINDDIIDIVCKLKPHRATLVPENRAEVTTEGGLDLKKQFKQIKKVIKKLHNRGIETSLFIDPTYEAVKLTKELNASWCELHTGAYANIYAMLYGGLNNTHHSIKELELSRKKLAQVLDSSLNELKNSAKYGSSLGLKVAAGHGLNYQNLSKILDIKDIIELNIGQSIIARSVFTGLYQAIKDMKDLVEKSSY